MLSPSMMTNSNGNTCRTFAIWAATSYCERDPVPLSPMMANRTESSSRGGLTSIAGCGGAACVAWAERCRSNAGGRLTPHMAPDRLVVRTTARKKRCPAMGLLRLLRHRAHEYVDDHIGVT